MKLLRLKITSENGFRSLQKNFEICFRRNENLDEMSSFHPFCLVGLNGCGKSNVMEAIAHIFYHVELCISKHIPDYILEGGLFSPQNCVIDAFVLEYLIAIPNNQFLLSDRMRIVRISKNAHEAPELNVYKQNDKKQEVFHAELNEDANELYDLIKSFLPKYVVAYSSGENETLSVPFIKSRLLHMEEFKQATVGDYKNYIAPENNLIFIDANMSQAILLCCFLFENNEVLKILSDNNNTGILKINRFRMCLRNKYFNGASLNKEYSYFHLLKRDLFPKLQACCTMSWFDDKDGVYYFDFYVNEATKMAFRKHFGTSMNCFQMFRLLYELNYYSLEVNDVKNALGNNLVVQENKLGRPSGNSDIFHFSDFYINKKIDATGKFEQMTLDHLSDGEHQFVHTTAICLLLKDAESLLLMDEPETHFNPSWRSRFISILDETLKVACDDNKIPFDEVNLRKEILITSHSPFIISDCLPTNVFVLNKDKFGNTEAKSAAEKGVNTFGTSISLLMARFFGSNATIGTLAEKGIKEIVEKGGSKDDIKRKLNETFGDSVEKLLAIDNL